MKKAKFNYEKCFRYEFNEFPSYALFKNRRNFANVHNKMLYPTNWFYSDRIELDDKNNIVIINGALLPKKNEESTHY